jgi:hypothetical protein
MSSRIPSVDELFVTLTPERRLGELTKEVDQHPGDGRGRRPLFSVGAKSALPKAKGGDKKKRRARKRPSDPPSPRAVGETPNRIFDDLEPIKEAARRLNKHPRTLMRWTRLPDGLPFVRLGQVPYLHVPSAKAWIESRIRRPNPVRAARRMRDIKRSR